MTALVLPLLQIVPTLKQGDTRSNIIGILVFLLFFGFLAIAGSRGGGISKGSSVRGGKKAFKRLAGARGLDRRETALLRQVADQAGTAPIRLVQSSGALDSALKRTFINLENNPHPGVDKEVRKLELYRLKQKLERSGSGGIGNYGSTKQLPLGQQITIQEEEGGRYQSKINGNLQKNLSLTVPVDSRGNQIRWKKWTKIKIFFWKANGQGYSFESKVLAYNQLRGVSSLFIQHSNSIKREQQRRYRRKEMNRPAYFYPIKVISSGIGKNIQKKAIVEHKKGTLGTVIDVSSGGCSMKSNYPLGKGELIKIEFDTGKERQVTTYGKVRGMTKNRPIGGIMHIQFTRLSRRNLNRINSYIYDFESSTEKIRTGYN
jgi:c-di-GMP-binding flagellar brake protein YcgR